MGKINLYYGVVNSRKSSELLLSAHRNKQVGKKIMILQSDINTRDGGFVKSRALKEPMEAIVISKDYSVLQAWKDNGKSDLIFIDEIQFFSEKSIEDIIFLANLPTKNILIFCYGLMSDFKGNIFPTINYLLPFCTKIKEIETVCAVCHEKKATMNLMVGEHSDDNGISVGNHFEGVCTSCWLSKNLEKARENDDYESLKVKIYNKTN